jgi:hypothetical protein
MNAEETPDKFNPTIDPNRLDEEWLVQPRMYFKYAKRLADARLAVEEKKNRMEAIAAEIGNDMRLDPSAFDMAKATEESVKGMILTQPLYKNAHAAWLKAKHEADILAAAVTALDHRKKALENLVELHGQAYYAEPTARGEAGAAGANAITRGNTRRRGYQDDDE